MTALKEVMENLSQEAKSSLSAVQTVEELEVWRVSFIGRKGQLSTLLGTVKDLSDEEKREVGQAGNSLKQELEQLYEAKKNELGAGALQEAGEFEMGTGHIHPLTLTINRIVDIFSALGFQVVEGPEVEEQKYNFDLLNIPKEHPARAETDTFFIENLKGTDNLSLILRTHVSPMQIRGPKEYNIQPPYKIVYFGRTFRPEKADATHESVFHQFEFMVVSETASLVDLKGIIKTFYSTFFGKEVTIRLRPSYFPFVEPGVEVDISCVFCEGSGCNVCKHTGWIEIAGAGMVHPNVLKNLDIDPEKFQGFALGGAIDRLAMLRHGINDIRLFWSGDIRFLRQFS